MPFAPSRKCQTAGCNGLAIRSDYCPTCTLRRTARKAEQYWPNNTGGYYTSHRWRVARTEYLTEHPHCARCGQLATVVDHITSHHGDMLLFWDRSNWQAMCTKCHNSKTACERNEYRRRLKIDDV